MFAHLHLHTQYSLLDGAASDRSVDGKAQGAGHDGLRHHGPRRDVWRGGILSGRPKKRGIHPVIGCEVYVCPNMDDRLSGARDYNHLILLCGKR